MNPATFTTSSLSFFDQAWHQIAVTGVSAVAGSGNTAFVVTFATQTAAAGLYRIHLTAAIKSSSGASLAAYDGTVTVQSAPAKPPAATPPKVSSLAGSGPTAYSLSQGHGDVRPGREPGHLHDVLPPVLRPGVGTRSR